MATSIELLKLDGDVKKSKWKAINILPKISHWRHSVVFCPISETSLLIAGGFSSQITVFYNDGFFFDTKDFTSKPLSHQSNLSFTCVKNQVVKTRSKRLIALISTKKAEERIAKVNMTNLSVTIVQPDKVE